MEDDDEDIGDEIDKETEAEAWISVDVAVA